MAILVLLMASFTQTTVVTQSSTKTYTFSDYYSAEWYTYSDEDGITYL